MTAWLITWQDIKSNIYVSFHSCPSWCLHQFHQKTSFYAKTMPYMAYYIKLTMQAAGLNPEIFCNVTLIIGISSDSKAARTFRRSLKNIIQCKFQIGELLNKQTFCNKLKHMLIECIYINLFTYTDKRVLNRECTTALVNLFRRPVEYIAK